MAPDTSCAVFGQMDLNLDPNQIHRFVVGENAAPVPMNPPQAAAELGDPFATLVLLQGTFPGTAEEAVDAIQAASPDGDPLRERMSFLLGEGSQIPFDGAADVNRGLRFVVTLGATPNGPPQGPDVLVSVSHPRQTGVELMAWDRQNQGFNFYRSMGDPPAWVFAGNARHALADPTQGNGPFESHTSGALLMKELKVPWVHWDSTFAHITASVFSPDDDRRTHPWFTEKEPGGAYTFEFEIARPAIARWAKARFQALAKNDGGTIDAARILRQIVETPTANVTSSKKESRSVGQVTPIDLPPTFFVDADGLAEVGLQGPPAFEVPRQRYQASLNTFGVHLDDGQGFTTDLDTHFAFVVPERALEDQLALREAIAIGLVSRRLVACLLMTDFPNPIFSDRRAALMAHVPAAAEIQDGATTFSQDMADAILAAAATAPQGSPEREFEEHWNVEDSFEGPFNALLADYYAGVQAGLATQEGFDAYFRLAESRRQKAVEELPIFGEFDLLFAQTNITPADRAMRRDGTVSEP
jgi:hypothetical protein